VWHRRFDGAEHATQSVWEVTGAKVGAYSHHSAADIDTHRGRNDCAYGRHHTADGCAFAQVHIGHDCICPNWDTTYLTLIPDLVQLNRIEEATLEVAEFRELAPTATVSRLRELLAIRSPETLEMVLDGMSIAALPE
jgi:hypothetical protein